MDTYGEHHIGDEDTVSSNNRSTDLNGIFYGDASLVAGSLETKKRCASRVLRTSVHSSAQSGQESNLSKRSLR